MGRAAERAGRYWNPLLDRGLFDPKPGWEALVLWFAVELLCR